MIHKWRLVMWVGLHLTLILPKLQVKLLIFRSIHFFFPSLFILILFYSFLRQQDYCGSKEIQVQNHAQLEARGGQR